MHKAVYSVQNRPREGELGVNGMKVRWLQIDHFWAGNEATVLSSNRTCIETIMIVTIDNEVIVAYHVKRYVVIY